MKASEVLRIYRTGQRDFQGVNLRGQSFKGQDLSGADFSEADIRSANFTGANLRGAKFCGAKAGLQRRWAAPLVIISWLLAGISGLGSLMVAALVSLIFESDLDSHIAGFASSIVLIFFLILIIHQGIRVEVVVAAVSSVAVAVAVGAVVEAVAAAEAAAAAEAVAVVAAAAGAVVAAVAVAVAAASLLAGAVAEAVAVVAAVAVAVAAAAAVSSVAVAVVAAVAVAALVVIVGMYIGGRALKGDERDVWVRSFAIAFAATGGTRFRGADLTEANFTGARLKSTDLRKAILTRVRWYRVEMLDYVRPGDTYLKDAQLRQWLIGEGKDNNFDRQDLRGVNLQGAILTDASFIGADLSGANLQDANLSKAKLVQTLLDKTDLTGATLTGAYIVEWSITTSTILNGVKCQYFFRRLPTKEDPEPYRKPDNRSKVFKDGEFADFIKPIVDTLDLYHNQEVDPRVIGICLEKLAENNPDAQLRFASMEVKGEDNLLLRLKTAPGADLSSLNADYFDTYNRIKALAEADSKKLLTEKDSRIQQLANMVNTALKRPSFYAEHYNHQGDNEMTGEKRNINQDLKGASVGSAYTEKMEAEQVGGTIINEAQKQNLAEAAAEIQQLLNQLSQTYPTSTTAEQMVVATEAIKRIESDPKLMERILSALKAGSISALEQLLNHPAASFVIAALEDWQESKEG